MEAALAARGFQVDLSYRRKAAKRGDYEATGSCSPHRRAVDTSDFHTLAHETFSLSRYAKMPPTYAATHGDALEAAAVLREKYQAIEC